MSEAKLLPEGSCLLHIGPYKTGSTSIQSAMHSARDRLGEHGVLYAGRGTRDRRAGWAVMESKPRGADAPSIDEWNALVAEVRGARDLRVCVSNEDFARVGPKYAARIADDLGRDRLHVLAVARRFDRLLPSQWQERVKCYETLTYDQYLREVLDPSSEHQVRKAFWASHGVEGMAERWASLVGPENITIVVSDDSDRRLLVRTFEAMLGLPEGFLEPGSMSNPSFAANGVEFLRRLNEAFASDDALTDPVYYRLIQRGAIPRMRLAERSELDERIPAMPAWAREKVAELSRERVATLERLGVNVLGDPDLLLVPSDLDGPDQLPPPPDSVSIDTAVRAVEGVVQAALKERRRLQNKARKQPSRPVGRPLDDQTSGELLREVAGRLVRKVRPGRG